jgi:hypothetical protein
MNGSSSFPKKRYLLSLKLKPFSPYFILSSKPF